MRIDTIKPAASAADQPPMAAAAGLSINAADGGAAASHQRAEALGPPTTRDMSGAGGPFNSWDAKIAAARRRGNPQLAKRLQEARARINLSFEHLEPVWIPTNGQRGMLALRAGAAANGLATAKAA